MLKLQLNLVVFVYCSVSNIQSTSISKIKASSTKETKFYLFMGDPQCWWMCDDTNEPCQRTVEWCTKIYPPDLTSVCQLYSGQYTNKAQLASISKLASEIADFHTEGIEGLVINGDLTAYGHTEELYNFRWLWRKYSTFDYMASFKMSPNIDKSYADNIKNVYMGLGNHDYANNIDDCVLNNCAVNMVEYMLQSFPMNSSVDVSEPSKISHHIYQGVTYSQATERHGSLSYSWKTCDTSKENCLLFLQLNNYPTYKTVVNTWNAKYNVTESLGFVKQQLRDNQGLGVIINFHDIDDHFGQVDKMRFVDALTGPFEILAIFVAHYHSLVGLRDYLCVNHRHVPVLYSGSVPANNYILAQFSMKKLDLLKNPPKYYSVNVVDAEGGRNMNLLSNINYDAC